MPDTKTENFNFERISEVIRQASKLQNAWLHNNTLAASWISLSLAFFSLRTAKQEILSSLCFTSIVQCIVVTALQSAVLALDFKGLISLIFSTIETVFLFHESPELRTRKIIAHYGICVVVALATVVVTLAQNHFTVVEELKQAEGKIRDCELQTRITASEKINFGVFAIQMPPSTFGTPEVIHANNKTREITGCKTNE